MALSSRGQWQRVAKAGERERGCDERERERERESKGLWAVVRERESDINEKLEI